jgi:hypothetical protein
LISRWCVNTACTCSSLRVSGFQSTSGALSIRELSVSKPQ